MLAYPTGRVYQPTRWDLPRGRLPVRDRVEPPVPARLPGLVLLLAGDLPFDITTFNRVNVIVWLAPAVLIGMVLFADRLRSLSPAARRSVAPLMIAALIQAPPWFFAVASDLWGSDIVWSLEQDAVVFVANVAFVVIGLSGLFFVQRARGNVGDLVVELNHVAAGTGARRARARGRRPDARGRPLAPRPAGVGRRAGRAAPAAARRGPACDLYRRAARGRRARARPGRPARAARGGRLRRAARARERAPPGRAPRPARRATRVARPDRPCRRRGAPPARARPPRRRPATAARARDGAPAPRRPRRPVGPGELLAESEVELQQALRELRELAQGIHPAALTDNGLADAVRTLAQRAPVPVTVDDRTSSWAASRATSRPPPTSSSPSHSRTSRSTRTRARPGSPSAARTATRTSRSATTERAAPTPTAARGLHGLADRVGALDGN